jgi:NhaP-type Na+/H+ or K+/H+ antiporter
VLASDVSVGPPGRGEEGEIRFGLTAEAALNDGLAFPFVALAIVLTTIPPDAVTLRWVEITFFWQTGAGLVLGWLFGRGFGWFMFKNPIARLSETSGGIVAMGIAAIVFAIAEILTINVFLAVFAAALGLRASCPEAGLHKRMDAFTDQVERLLAMLLLAGFGAALGSGLLSQIRWPDAVLGLLLLLVLRPVAGWVSLIGSPHPAISRALTAFFGIRGIGTLYYLLFALHRGKFANTRELAATIGFTILCSLVMHGITATPLMRLADLRRAEYLKKRRAANRE